MKCNGKKIIPILDFNQVDFSSNNETKVKTAILEYIKEQLQVTLKVHSVPTITEEYGKFWKEQIELLRTDETHSLAFTWIVNALPDASIKSVEYIPDDELKLRKELRSRLEREEEKYLDYLVRLWGFIIREYYGNRNSCAFIVFDNIDRASPIAQSILVTILEACKRDPGPTFIVLLRPETFDRLGMGTHVVDRENHEGPLPSNVVIDRLSRFVKAPDTYFIPEEGLALSEFNIIKQFLLRVYDLINKDFEAGSPYLTFIDKACGRSIRLGLLAAQKLLLISEHDMRDDFSVYTLIRVAITSGNEQFREQSRSSISNLFHVKGEEYGRLLVKPRILKLLLFSLDKCKTLNELRSTLTAFGYPETTLIRKAINECSNIYCQLIRSDGFNSYEDEREFLNSGNQRVTLTEIGEGYVTYLLNSVEYVQEVMLDCFIPLEQVNMHLGFQYLTDKFHLLALFLREVVRADGIETGLFLGEYGKQEYFNLFGKYLISMEIVTSVDRSVRNIILSQKSKAKQQQWELYKNVLDEFLDLVLYAANTNNDKLGIWPEYADIRNSMND